MPTMLSKSHVLAGSQCQRRLWLEANRPELVIPSPETQRLFRQGHRLNDVVHHATPQGVLIAADVPLSDALAFTEHHLAHTPDKPLFEATFEQHQVLVRADMVQHIDGTFQLTEVKSSARLKPYHLSDCAIQAWVIGEAGYPVGKTVLAHVDSSFVYGGDGRYDGLLRHDDVTGEVQNLLPGIPGLVDRCLTTLAGPEPAIDIGPHCNMPFACLFRDHCTPPRGDYPVTLFPNGGKTVTTLLAEGIEDIRAIPPGRLKKALHERIRVATVTGEPQIDPALGARLQALPYPRYYLDFETIQFVVPVWRGTRPYEQLPFQWSCHVEHDDGTVTHTEFLDVSGEAPMRACAEQLVEALGETGPILMYSPFERRVIRALAARFPDLGPALTALAERLLDLLPLIKAHYYHPAMRGSFSIKAVLPTVAPELDYGALGAVNNGTAAQSAYEDIIAGTLRAAQRDRLEQALRRYCALDTQAMLALVRYFSKTPT